MANQSKQKLPPEQSLTAWLHQDRLMWSRLQTLMTVQAVALGSAFAIRETPFASGGAILTGVVLSLCMWWLRNRDRQDRDIQMKKIEETYDMSDWTLGRKGIFGLTGDKMFWVILWLFFIADGLVGVGVFRGWF